MSFSISWVLPRLAVGSAPENAADARRLASLGVTDVLDVRLKPMDFEVDTTNADAIYAGTGIRYHSTPMRDNGAQKTPAQYADAVTFARDVLAQRGTKLFVHCAAGQYRSPGVIYAILRAMGYSGFPGFDAVGAPIGQSDAWSLIANVRTVYPQYVRGAEAAVPSLPRVALGDAEPAAAGGGLLWAAAAVGVGVFLLLRGQPPLFAPARANPHDDPRIARVARRFSRILRSWLTPSELRSIVQKNRVSDSCASHEYCDPNDAMAQAFKTELGLTPADFDYENPGGGYVALWADAWGLARKNHFYVESQRPS